MNVFKKGLSVFLGLALIVAITISVPAIANAQECYDITAGMPLIQTDRSANIIVAIKNNTSQPVSCVVYNAITMEVFSNILIAPDVVGHEYNLRSPRQENEILVVELRDVTGGVVDSEIAYVNNPYVTVPTTAARPELLVPVMVPVYSAPYTAYPIPDIAKPVFSLR